MVSTTAILCVLSSLIVLGSSCTVKSTSYTTEGMLFLLIIQNLCNIKFLYFLISDLQVISNSISFIAEFSLKCPNQIDNMPLFAVLPNGRIAYVFRVGDKYQVNHSVSKMESPKTETCCLMRMFILVELVRRYQDRQEWNKRSTFV